MRKSFFIVTCIILSLPKLTAQISFFPNQAMIVKESIEPSLVVVCSAYKLQDSSGQLYGRNNRAEFSQCYTLGVVTDSGLITAASAIQPWMLDADFALSRFRQSHTPVLSVVSYRYIGNNLYKSLPMDADHTTSLLMNMSIDSSIGIPSLALHTDTTYKNGWLLWCFVSDTLGKAGHVSTTAIMCSAELNDSVSTQRVTTPVTSGMVRDSIASRKVIGAVWVIPCYPKAGFVQFRVAGMAVQDSTGWLLAPIRKKNKNNIKNPSQESDNELTPSPISKQPQEKKNKKTNGTE